MSHMARWCAGATSSLTPAMTPSRPARRWRRLSPDPSIEHDLFGKPASTFPDHARSRDVYGSSLLSLACLNHLRNMSSVSIISVKPARLIFTVETIDGGPDSAW